MGDVVVTVPKGMWADWLTEGDLAPAVGSADWEGQAEYHFWLHKLPDDIYTGDRVYVVAHGRVRGYAPLVRVEVACRLRPESACLVRRGLAVAVTIPQHVPGFQGFRYRFWDRHLEVPFPNWRTVGVR